MIFLINPEHSIGCDNQILGEVSNNLSSKEEKFGHQSACTLHPRIGEGRVPTHQSLQSFNFADSNSDLKPSNASHRNHTKLSISCRPNKYIQIKCIRVMLEIYSLDPSVSALDNHSLHGSQIRPILQEILGWK